MMSSMRMWTDYYWDKIKHIAIIIMIVLVLPFLMLFSMSMEKRKQVHTVLTIVKVEKYDDTRCKFTINRDIRYVTDCGTFNVGDNLVFTKAKDIK